MRPPKIDFSHIFAIFTYDMVSRANIHACVRAGRRVCETLSEVSIYLLFLL